MSVEDNEDVIQTKFMTEGIMEKFDVVFVEQVNHGYDKNLNNMMFHWELNKLFSLTGNDLFKFAEDNNEKIKFNRSSMHRFIRGLKSTTTIAMVNQDYTFVSLNHPDYDDYHEESKEKNPELF